MNDASAERDMTRDMFERVRLIQSSCSPAQRHDFYRYREPVEDDWADFAAAVRFLPDRYLSHKCADGRWHSGCAGAGAAWDFILDRAVTCDCDCHQPAMQ